MQLRDALRDAWRAPVARHPLIGWIEPPAVWRKLELVTAPTFKAAGTVSSSSPAWPASHAINDLALLLVVNPANSAIGFSNAQGFVEITNSPQGQVASGGGTSGDSSSRLGVYWCRATSTSMAAPSFSSSYCGVIITFQDVTTTGNPWDVTAGDHTADLASPVTAVTIPSVTTTQSDCLIVAIVGSNQGGGGAITVSGWSGGATTERVDTGVDFGAGGAPCVAAASGPKTAAGSTGTTTATLSASSGQDRITIALRPNVVIRTADVYGDRPRSYDARRAVEADRSETQGFSYVRVPAALVSSVSTRAPDPMPAPHLDYRYRPETIRPPQMLVQTTPNGQWPKFPNTDGPPRTAPSWKQLDVVRMVTQPAVLTPLAARQPDNNPPRPRLPYTPERSVIVLMKPPPPINPADADSDAGLGIVTAVAMVADANSDGLDATATPSGAGAVPWGSIGAGVFALDLQPGAVVTYTWATPVIKTESGKEQRTSVNNAPRQRYEAPAFLLGADDRALRAALMAAAQGSTFLLALPYEELTLAADNTGATLNTTPTSRCDWASAGQLVVVVGRDGSRSAVRIVQSAGANTIVLDADPGSPGLRGGRVQPLMEVILDEQQGFARYPITIERWDIRAIAKLNGFAGGLFGTGETVTLKDGIPLWDRWIDTNGAGDQVHTLTETVEFGGKPTVIASAAVPDWAREVPFESASVSDFQWLKKFLATIRGSQVAFLLSTRRADMVCVVNPPIGANLVISIPPTAGAADFFKFWPASTGHRYVSVKRADGVTVVAEITAAVNNGDGTATLALDAAIAGTVSMVSWAELVRLESDEVALTWNDDDDHSWSFATSLHARVVQR